MAGKHYDTVTKPALREIGEAFAYHGHGAFNLRKRAVDAAAKAGATPAEIADAVGGRAAWNRFVRVVKSRR
jgi:hypothetical protein